MKSDYIGTGSGHQPFYCVFQYAAMAVAFILLLEGQEFLFRKGLYFLSETIHVYEKLYRSLV